IKQKLNEVPGYSFEVMPFLTERIKETLSGTSGTLAVKVYGDDLAAIDRATIGVAKALNSVPGREGVRMEPQTGHPELVVRVRTGDASRFGLRNGQVLDAVHVAFHGALAGQVYD